jgi:hypothetical protein
MGIWIRSYTWTDRFFVQPAKSQCVEFTSFPGHLLIGEGGRGDELKPLFVHISPRPVKTNPKLSGRPIFAGFAWAFSGAALLPTFLWKRRSWEVSLRGLFVVTTFLALAMGVFVWLDRASIGS